MRAITGLLIAATVLLGTSRPHAHDLLVNREATTASELSNAAEQEQMRRHFLQGWR